MPDFERIKKHPLSMVVAKLSVLVLVSILGPALGSAYRMLSVGSDLAFVPGLRLDELALLTIWASCGYFAVFMMIAIIAYLAHPKCPVWIGFAFLFGFAFIEYQILDSWAVKP